MDASDKVLEVSQNQFEEVIHHPRREIDEIIERHQIEIHFQPIIDTGKPRIHGYEALSRGPEGSQFRNPLNLFDAAERVGRLVELESICQTLTFQSFAERKLGGRLFVNISPMFLLNHELDSKQLLSQLQHFNIPPKRIVLEISEKYPFDEFEKIQLALEQYRQLGFKIALDDLGAGYAGLRIWSELRPDYVKVDRHFANRIQDDPIKREFIRSIKGISKSLRCDVIAEGVEDDKELNTIRSTGISLVQGHLFGKPAKLPEWINKNSLKENHTSLDTHIAYVTSENVSLMVEEASVLTPAITLEQAADIFQSSPELASIPIVDDGKPLGIITRVKIMEIFLGRYGRELHARKPVSNFMHRAVIVDHEISLDEVSRMITKYVASDLNVDFIITRDDKYIGVGKIRKLLKRITDKQMRSARYSNPLTLLPGNVPIYEWIDDLLANQSDFHIAYFDINNFKPYNDIYGYSRGDEVIVMLAEILCEHANRGENLVGHIGGDDFVIIFRSEDWHERCVQILEQFEQETDSFYTAEDNRNGGIWSQDRNGQQQFFGKIGLAVGIVNPDAGRCSSHHDIATLASDAKSHAKKLGGNSIFVSRRQGPSEPVHVEKFKTA